ncbi:MAG: UDP-N-acetylmuramoyl-L-alanine--D-glutamate ligase [Actinomycetota bacterium]|nr:UDP-N-acetylmuramoyl-L-alanine--D-glutamate ligase [Actinomycetota bacterium]
MISRPPLPSGPLLVVGLARSGVAAAFAARERGREVAGVDSKSVPDSVGDALRAAGIEVRTADDGVAWLTPETTVVKSPGVPQDAAVVVAARERGLPVIGELELAWRMLPNPFVAVTGSNGKTTTVELLGHIFEQAGKPARVAGNVGTALSSLAGKLDDDAVVICEASSFQLEDTDAFAPEVAVLLNVADDHLDRHKTSEAYRAAKLRIFARQPPGTFAVVPEHFQLADVAGDATKVTFGSNSAPGMCDHDDALWWEGELLIPNADIRLRGAHNRENAMAAATSALCFGLPREAVVAGLESFSGVAHRLEEVATRDGVLYVNDSKATNVASAVVGISSFESGVHVILGGRGKGGDYTPLTQAVAAHCARVYVIGESAPEIASAVATAAVPVSDCGDLETAVARARAAAAPGEVVLLSPACASFDQFESFEERGRRFRELVQDS